MKKTLLYLLTFSIALTCFAQVPQWVVYNTTNSGLPYNNVLTISIDNNTKWIGTGDNFQSDGTFGGGLTEFNNSSWVTHQNESSVIPNNEYKIWSIAIDEQNRTWLGTGEYDTNIEGMSVFDGNNWTNYTTSNSGLPDYVVTDIKIDVDGNKWIGTLNDGLVKYDGIDWTIYNTDNSYLPNNYIRSIAIDKYDTLWIGTLDGVAKFDGVNWTVYNTDNSVLPHNCINAIAVDKINRKWIGTESGLATCTNLNWNVFTTENSDLPDNKVNCISTEPWVYAWVGTDYGLARLTGSSCIVYDTTNSELPSNQINSVFVDQYENKWIGTDTGLAVFREEGVDLPVDHCPGTFVQYSIGTQTVDAHTSVYNETSSCWTALTEILSDATTPSGVDIAVVVLELDGYSGSIVDFYTNEPISEGDTLYVRKNNIYTPVRLKHLNHSGLTFQYLIVGNPVEYNQLYSCSYSIENLNYIAECINYGVAIIGVGTCYTCNPTQVSENLEITEITIYPNPTSNTVVIEGFILGEIKLMNMQGVIIKTIPVSDVKQTIDISKLTSGIYLLKLQTKNGFKIKKIVKQ